MPRLLFKFHTVSFSLIVCSEMDHFLLIASGIACELQIISSRQDCYVFNVRQK